MNLSQDLVASEDSPNSLEVMDLLSTRIRKMLKWLKKRCKELIFMEGKLQLRLANATDPDNLLQVRSIV